MNRKLIALLLAVVMLLCIGCKNKDNDTTGATEAAETQPSTEPAETVETVPGTADNILDPNGFEEDETEPEKEEADETIPAESEDQEADENLPAEPKATEPENTEPDSTEPESTEPENTEPDADDHKVTYEEYNNMSPEEQLAFFNQFASMEDFVTWHNEAKAEYEKENGSIDVGDGNIDMGNIGKS